MSKPSDTDGATRRLFLGGAAGLAGAGLASAAAAKTKDDAPPLIKTKGTPEDKLLPFYGEHQNGVATPIQAHTYFAAFDVTTDKRADLIALMRAWTEAAAKLTAGQPVAELADPAQPAGDTGEAADMPPTRLTLTFGFGPSLFLKDGVDRFGLQKHRPSALIDMPHFVGDQLVPERTGGDLSVQAAADDPQVCFHAVRQLARLADGVATLRWVQAGFVPGYDPKVSPRNLMGFKDGSMNVAVTEPKAMDQFVWADPADAAWMKGGTYLVARPIRMALEHWDRMKLGFQEQTIGRHKQSGAGIGAKGEFEPLKLDANDKDGNPLIAENAHVRLAAPEANDGAQILRRSYSYDNGVSMVAERWPPWRHAMEFDAGLLFICYQRDPRTGFVKLFERMSKFDMLNQFVTHVGGGLFACPGGVQKGRYIGQTLFEAA
jgi:deferrochelatase/peroxidase EfeB